MFKTTKAFSGFSVNDLDAARKFYGETLGLDLSDDGPGFVLKIADGTNILVYPKRDHTPATFTILNFPVDDIDAAVDELAKRGVTFLRYEGMDQDVFRAQDPPIAWFNDPAGNVLSVLQVD